MPSDKSDSLRPDEVALLSRARAALNSQVTTRAAELVIGMANRLQTDEDTRREYFKALENQFKL